VADEFGLADAVATSLPASRNFSDILTRKGKS